MILILALMAVAFGLGVIAAFLAYSVKHRRAVPVWANQTDRTGRFGGKE